MVLHVGYSMVSMLVAMGSTVCYFYKEKMLKKTHSSETIKPLLICILDPNILFGHCSDRVKRKEFYVQYGVTSGIPLF